MYSMYFTDLDQDCPRGSFPEFTEFNRKDCSLSDQYYLVIVGCLISDLVIGLPIRDVIVVAIFS